MSDVYNEIVGKLGELTDDELSKLIGVISNDSRIIHIGNWYSRDQIKRMYPVEFRDWKVRKSLGEIDEENYWGDMFDCLKDSVGDGIDSADDEIDYQIKNNDTGLWGWGI